MSIITFFDLVQDKKFRADVEKRIATETGCKHYSFPNILPRLYKYCTLSSFAVKNIVEGQITLTNIGEFNDLYDGAIHQYGTKEECERIAEDEWSELSVANVPESILQHKEYVGLSSEYLKTESRLNFRFLEYLGTYVCCFSSKCDSTLMWSHYANSNTGMCVEYDFNNPGICLQQKKMIFPIAYSKFPIDLHDLLVDKRVKDNEHSLESAVLCAALNKADIWSYEDEWRMVFVLPTEKNNCRRIPLSVSQQPASIALGYHFLKSFFYYENEDYQELSKSLLTEFLTLLKHVKEKKISISIMVPAIGKYGLIKKPVEIDKLTKMMEINFPNKNPKNMQYYYTIHDQLMDIIEKEEPQCLNKHQQ